MVRRVAEEIGSGAEEHEHQAIQATEHGDPGISGTGPRYALSGVR